MTGFDSHYVIGGARWYSIDYTGWKGAEDSMREEMKFLKKRGFEMRRDETCPAKYLLFD
jgi:hypothetical protein